MGWDPGAAAARFRDPVGGARHPKSPSSTVRCCMGGRSIYATSEHRHQHTDKELYEPLHDLIVPTATGHCEKELWRHSPSK